MDNATSEIIDFNKKHTLSLSGAQVIHRYLRVQQYYCSRYYKVTAGSGTVSLPESGRSFLTLSLLSILYAIIIIVVYFIISISVT